MTLRYWRDGRVPAPKLSVASDTDQTTAQCIADHDLSDCLLSAVLTVTVEMADASAPVRLCVPHSGLPETSEELLLIRVMDGVWELIPCAIHDGEISVVFNGTSGGGGVSQETTSGSFDEVPAPSPECGILWAVLRCCTLGWFVTSPRPQQGRAPPPPSRKHIIAWKAGHPLQRRRCQTTASQALIGSSSRSDAAGFVVSQDSRLLEGAPRLLAPLPSVEMLPVERATLTRPPPIITSIPPRRKWSPEADSTTAWSSWRLPPQSGRFGGDELLARRSTSSIEPPSPPLSPPSVAVGAAVAVITTASWFVLHANARVRPSPRVTAFARSSGGKLFLKLLVHGPNLISPSDDWGHVGENTSLTILRSSQLLVTLDAVQQNGTVEPRTLEFNTRYWSGEQQLDKEVRIPAGLCECFLKASPFSEEVMSICLDTLVTSQNYQRLVYQPSLTASCSTESSERRRGQSASEDESASSPEQGQRMATRPDDAHPLVNPRRARSHDDHDIFISYAVDPDAPTFQTVRMAFQVLGLNVFNPDVHMSRLVMDGGASGVLMQQHVRKSKLVLAVLSPGGPIFRSPWCCLELSAAKEAGIPVLPIYNGDVSGLLQIKDLIDGRVKGLGKDAAEYDLIKYVFKEQVLELVSTQHASENAQRIAELAQRIQRSSAAPSLGAPQTLSLPHSQ